MRQSLTVWSEPTGGVVPKSETSPVAIVAAATGLPARDQKQIIAGFKSESYEMVAGFILSRALAQLKKQLSSLGMEFVGEMLGRQDLNEDSVPTTSISNHEAIRLARELGIISGTDAKRLAQHVELIAHFESLEQDVADEEEMTKEEAVGFLRTCVNAILAKSGNVAPNEFVSFRSELESRTLKPSEPAMNQLIAAPYFFKRTTLSIIISNLKTKYGAQLEHSMGNVIAIVPAIWTQLRDAEKWSLGQAYAESVNEGKTAQVTALRKALMSVQGFDYVPETLRSQTFSAAASAIISAHTSADNFYNEPAAVSALVKLGSTIPWPAFPICMSAILSVYLGNSYGHSWAAQSETMSLLKRLSSSQWQYYFNECLSNDQLILQKLAWQNKPMVRWLDLFEQVDITEVKAKDKDIGKILAGIKAKDGQKVKMLGEKLLTLTEMRT